VGALLRQGRDLPFTSAEVKDSQVARSGFRKSKSKEEAGVDSLRRYTHGAKPPPNAGDVESIEQMKNGKVERGSIGICKTSCLGSHDRSASKLRKYHLICADSGETTYMRDYG
jgi:hypothetical protein